MPLKYKKLVVLFSMGIMLIGLGTFSMLSPHFNWNFASGRGNKLSKPASFGAISTVDGKSKSEIQSEIEDLMNRYFTAKQQVDMTTIEQCVSDVGHVEEKKLLAESEYVEAYQDIQCLVLDGAKEGTYRVYVYYNVKIYDIETLVPSLTALYVNLNDSGLFQVYLGTLDAKEQNYIESLDQSKEVSELVDTVQKRLEDVVSSDSKVRDFYEMLESVESDSSEVEENENIDQEGQTENSTADE